MKNSTLNLLLCLSILITACQKEKDYCIDGTLTGFPEHTKIYLKNLITDETIDSATIENGRFKLTGHLEDPPELLWLNTTVNNEFIYTNLLIENEKIELKGDIRDFPLHVTFNGSKTQNDLTELRDITRPFDVKRDSLVKTYLKAPKKEQEKKGRNIWEQIHSIDDTVKKLRIDYVKTHTNTYPGIINLGYLKNILPKDTLKSIYDKFSDELKSSKYGKFLAIHLNEKISKIGDSYHNFQAFDKNDNLINFSDLIGNKYILLDFMSASCGPCIQSITELNKITKTHSDSLQIVSFSGDPRKEVWLNSLRRDNVSWISLWDGKGRYSETYIKYGVNGFPTFFLINPKGKIIDKWGGYGKGSVIEKLSKLKNN